jgi:hypothetical protein
MQTKIQKRKYEYLSNPPRAFQTLTLIEKTK